MWLNVLVFGMVAAYVLAVTVIVIKNGVWRDE